MSVTRRSVLIGGLGAAGLVSIAGCRDDEEPAASRLDPADRAALIAAIAAEERLLASDSRPEPDRARHETHLAALRVIQTGLVPSATASGGLGAGGTAVGPADLQSTADTVHDGFLAAVLASIAASHLARAGRPATSAAPALTRAMNLVAALQAALAVEHQVVYGYGVVGARLGRRGAPVSRDQCVERLDAHRALRDHLAELLRRAGARPITSAPAYDLPFPVPDGSAAAQLGAVLEDAVAGAMWDAIAAAPSDSAARRLGVTQLAEAAAWAARWRASSGGAVPALPGQPVTRQPSTSPTSSSSSSTTPSGSTS
jgi:hypothetical protein